MQQTATPGFSQFQIAGTKPKRETYTYGAPPS
jgi:hypothetical protein